MFNTMYQMILLYVLLGGISVPVVQHVSGIDIYTTSEVEAVNGTDLKLRCTFRSSYPVSHMSVSVTWLFQGLNPGPEEAVFFYYGTSYLPTQGRFIDHVVWSGDVMKKVASITLQQVSLAFNGTYICQVRNILDVVGRNGEVVLRVINKTESFDQFAWYLDAVWH